MKKFGLVLAMLALVLVFGFTLVSCGDNGASKDMNGLFNELKGYTEIDLWAYADGFDSGITWCGFHQKWEPWQSGVGQVHGGTPAFDFSAATQISGGQYTTYFYDLYSIELRKYINTLDSFFEDGYKTGATQNLGWTNVTNSEIIWYSYWITKDGRGAYGSSATPTTERPLVRNLYSFP